MRDYTVTIARDDCHPVVVVRGEVDMTTADEFGAALGRALDGESRVEIDLSQTTFMDASGLAVLASAFRQLGNCPHSVVVHDPNPMIRTILDIAGMSALLDIRNDGRRSDPKRLA